MHQTFYIEADEEISSVVDKLRKSVLSENHFVIAGRSLMAQSSVNIKLLKREAEKLGKNIVIISQDDNVLKISEKSGIETRGSVGSVDLASDEFGKNSIQTSTKNNAVSLESPDPLPIQPSPISLDKGPVIEEEEGRLESVGSSDFYSARQKETFEPKSVLPEPEIAPALPKVVDRIERPRLSEVQPTPPRADSSPKLVSDFKVVSSQNQKAEPINAGQTYSKPAAAPSRSGYDLKKSFNDFLDPEKEKKLERILSHRTATELQSEARPVKRNPEKIPKKKNLAKIVAAFSIVLFFGAALAAAYFYVPSAKVIVYLEKISNKVNLELEADISGKDPNYNFTRSMEKEESIMLSYNSTGNSASSGQKAKGTLIIYNEYGSSPQALVATTRFKTEDGKIFRLIKGISVPGMTTVGGEKKPGAIEAEVVADEAGEAYNIDPSSFTIPGFEGGDKYSKIYAKSLKPMTGGGTSGDEIKSVSQPDIDGAKKETENALFKKMEELIKKDLGEGEIVLPGSPKFEISESLALAKIGEIRDTFDYQVKAKGRFVIISENKLRELAEEKYRSENKKEYEIVVEKIDLSYENSEADFDKGKAKFSVVADVTAKPLFDLEKFKEEIVSQSEDSIRKTMDKYQFIRSLDLVLNPEFMPTLPMLKGRILLEEREYADQ